MKIVRDLATLRAETAALRAAGRRLALVPTMGALHRGHIALVEAGQRIADAVAVSIFVNPLQFNQADDLARYPRDEEGDLAQLRAAGADLVWMPPVEAMYPPGSATVIEPSGPAQGFEGAYRPGHFRGVATVCCKLFLQTGAEVAMFGEKDWQQVQVVTRMAADLDVPVRIVPVETVREADGLALSSRNRFLTPAQRALAPMLFAQMTSAAAAMRAGTPPATALGTAEAALRQAGFVPDYLTLVEGPTMTPLEALPATGGRIVAAAALGSVRLLDNIAA